MVLEQLQALIDGKDIQTIPKYNWVPSTENILHDAFYTKEDVHREHMSWQPEFMKLALSQEPRSSSIGIVDTTKVSSYKPGLVLAAERSKISVDFLSSKDFITAALAEVFDSELMIIVANMRGRIAGVTTDMATNAERTISYPRNLAISSPEYIRSTLMKQFCGWKDSSHMETYTNAFLAADFGIITNSCSLTRFVVPKNTSLLAHAPASSFVKSMPVDTCVVFKEDTQGTIAINHNIRTDTESFKELHNNSLLFKNIISQ